MSIQDAFACKLAAKDYDLVVFLAARESKQIVFQGKVVSIEPMPTSRDGVSLQNIHLRISRWWRGQVRESVVVIGEQGILKGTSCDGVFDFSATVGLELLFVGYEENGVIRGSKQLTKVVDNGQLDEKILRLLEKSN